jgi:hypothetical protein
VLFSDLHPFEVANPKNNPIRIISPLTLIFVIN